VTSRLARDNVDAPAGGVGGDPGHRLLHPRSRPVGVVQLLEPGVDLGEGYRAQAGVGVGYHQPRPADRIGGGDEQGQPVRQARVALHDAVEALLVDQAAGVDVDGQHVGGRLVGGADQQQPRGPDPAPAEGGRAGEVGLHGAELAQVDQVDDGEVAGLAAEDGGGSVGGDRQQWPGSRQREPGSREGP